MFNIKQLLLAFILCNSISVVFAQRALVKTISIKGFRYTITNSSRYQHDDDLNVDYFIIRNVLSPTKQNSAIALAKRNDTVFMKGKYTVFQDKIEFTTYYYHQYAEGALSSDSSKTVFSPNQKGSLVLRKATNFKRGNAKEHRY